MGEADKEKLLPRTSDRSQSRTTAIKRRWVRVLPIKEDADGCAFCTATDSCEIVRSRTKLMHIMIETEKPQEAESIFGSLLKAGHKPSLITYTTLLAAFQNRCFKSIQSIISQVEENGMRPDSTFYNAAIYAFSESGNMEAAMETFWKMKEKGIKPDTGTYDSLIKGYNIAGKPEESVKLLDIISKEDNLNPSFKTYNFFIKAWCQKGNITEAWNVLHKMIASGRRPNTYTYNTIVTAYAQKGETDKAEDVISEMQKNGVQPNIQTCGIIINGYCKEGRIREGLRFVYRMRELRLTPNLIVCNSLIKGFVAKMDRDGIDEVLTLMETFTIKPDVITFSTIMHAWSTAGSIDKCKEIFDDMVEAGIKPDVHVYSILAKAYAHAGEPENAEGVLTAMIKSGFRPDVVIFTIVIRGWCSAGRMDCAVRVFNQMCEYGIAPNLPTFETLIWGYREIKQPWKAKEVIQIMRKFEVQPRRSTMMLLADTCRNAGLTQEADRMFANLRRKDTNEETAEEVMAVENLEKPYHKQTTGVSDPLLVPNTVAGGEKGSAAPLTKGRTVLREAVFSMGQSLLTTKSMSVSHSCKFVARLPIICGIQSQRPQGVYCQLAQMCTAVFLK